MPLLRKISETGFRYTLAILFCRIVPASIFRTRKFNLFRIQQNPESKTETSTHAYTIKWAELESEFAAAEQISGFQRVSSKGKLQVAIAISSSADSSVVGALWMAAEQFDEVELGITIQLSNHQRWLFSGYVSNELRGQGIYRQIFTFVYQDLTNESCVGWFAINPVNKRSMVTHQKLMAVSHGVVRATRILTCVNCSVKNSSTQFEIKTNRRWTFNFRKKPVGLTIANRT